MVKQLTQKIFMGTLAYYFINMKSLFAEKISFVWSITLPLIIFFINQNKIHTMQDLTYYWCYMITSSYLFGLGIYAVEMRESGCLKTIFSINNSKTAYILGNIFTQLTYTLICVSVFNLLAMAVTKMNYFDMEKYSLFVMLICFPIGFGSYCVSILHMFYISSLKTIVTIILFLTLALSGGNRLFYSLNLLFVIPEIIFGNFEHLSVYLALCVFSLFVGAIGIHYFEPISKERR